MNNKGIKAWLIGFLLLIVAFTILNYYDNQRKMDETIEIIKGLEVRKMAFEARLEDSGYSQQDTVSYFVEKAAQEDFVLAMEDEHSIEVSQEAIEERIELHTSSMDEGRQWIIADNYGYPNFDKYISAPETIERMRQEIILNKYTELRVQEIMDEKELSKEDAEKEFLSEYYKEIQLRIKEIIS